MVSEEAADEIEKTLVTSAQKYSRFLCLVVGSEDTGAHTHAVCKCMRTNVHVCLRSSKTRLFLASVLLIFLFFRYLFCKKESNNQKRHHY